MRFIVPTTYHYTTLVLFFSDHVITLMFVLGPCDNTSKFDFGKMR